MPFNSLPIPTRTVDIVNIEEKVRESASKTDLDNALSKTWFVSITSGSDFSAGLTPDTALLTLKEAKSRLKNGDNILLESGGVWREELDLFDFTNINVGSFGYGMRPLIDGSDVLPKGNFGLTNGRTKAYNIIVPHSMTSTNQNFNVFEDGKALIRATTIANCEATAGSFFAPSPTGLTDMVYVHPKNSTDPSVDSKNYECTTRAFCINGAKTGYIKNIRARRQGHDSGSIINRDYASNCIAEDGIKYNFCNLGIAEKCVASTGDNTSGSALFVSFWNAGTKRTSRYIDCIAQGNGRDKLQSGFHSFSTDATKNTHILYENCGANDCNAGFSDNDATNIILYMCDTKNCKTDILLDGVTTVDRVVILGGHYGSWDITTTTDTPRMISGVNSTTNIVVKGASVITRSCEDAMIYGNFNGGVEIENCDFLFLDKHGVDATVIKINAASVVSLNNSVLYGADRGIDLINTATYSGNNNSFFPESMDMTVDGVAHTSITSFKTVTSYDVNSITTDPAITNGARNVPPLYGFTSGVWGIGAGSSSISKQDLSEQLYLELAKSS